MNKNAQLACAWSGPVMVVIWVASFVVLAGFIPPPAPLSGEEEILRMFTNHAVPIRLGLIMTLFASALLVPWSAVIAVQMSRIEGKRPVLAITQVAQASLLSLEFIIPLMVWQTAAYRPTPERIHLVYMLNDMGWLMFVGVISSAVLQCLTLGIVILMDKRKQPIFPRWTGYLALWTALLLAPAGVVPLFKEGPFAWNGVFGFWVPLAIFCVWVSTTTWFLIAAIKRESDETAEAPATVLT
ncbi:hypothetical protein NWT09_12015 [Mycolicibacterium sp. jd]|uniref:hypothetical protein n=1 Tax=unclassified Mycolicibacterium TaxID=2636767 RepID=UPI00351B0AA8